MTSSAGLQRFIISSYPSPEINFVEIHLCMLQCWLLKQSWKQTPCGGKEGGEQGEKKRKERKLWPQLTGIKLCSVTLRKKRVVSSPPAVTQQNRYPQQAAVCAVLCPYLTGKKRCLSWGCEQVKRFLFTIESLKATTKLNVYWDASVILMSNFCTLFSQ